MTATELLILLLLAARVSAPRVPPASSVWGLGEPHDGGSGAERLRNGCGPSSLPCRPAPQARARPAQQLGEEVGGPLAPRPPVSPRDARASFLGRGTLGPGPGTPPSPPPPVGCSLFGAEPRALLGAETKSSQICLPGRLFAPSAWKASQRGSTPPPAPSRAPGDPAGQGRRA